MLCCALTDGRRGAEGDSGIHEALREYVTGVLKIKLDSKLITKDDYKHVARKAVEHVQQVRTFFFVFFWFWPTQAIVFLV